MMTSVARNADAKIRAVARLRDLCRRLTHIPTEAEQRLLDRFQLLERSPTTARADDLTPWRQAGARGGACVVPGTSHPWPPRSRPVSSTPIVAWPPTPLPRSWPVVPTSVEPRVGVHDETLRPMTRFTALVTAHPSR